MSYDTMAARDEGLEEAAELVRARAKQTLTVMGPAESELEAGIRLATAQLLESIAQEIMNLKET